METHYRVRWKIFCRVPITTSTAVIDTIIGSVKDILTRGASKIQERLLWKNKIPHARNLLLATTLPKYLPRQLPALLRICYSQKCKEHYTLCTTTHLRTSHTLDLDIPYLIKRYLDPKTRNSTRTVIKRAMEKIKELAQAPGRKPGPKKSIKPQKP